MDDLDDVARGERRLRVFRARHDFTVPFDRHRTVGEPQVLDEPPHGESVGDLAGFAIDGELHRGETLALGARPVDAAQGAPKGRPSPGRLRSFASLALAASSG